MKEYNFVINGEKEYEQKMQKIEAVYNQYMTDCGYYLYAVKEACINALCNCNDMDNIVINVSVWVSDDDIETTVAADTNDFSPEAIRAEYQMIADKYSKMDWGDYEALLPHYEQHRGIWNMLFACDYIFFAADGKKVTLVTKYPFNECYIKKIGSLVSRFLIEKSGVIF